MQFKVKISRIQKQETEVFIEAENLIEAQNILLKNYSNGEYEEKLERSSENGKLNYQFAESDGSYAKMRPCYTCKGGTQDA